MPTSRIEAFSDGVFAVAITLLALQLNVPAPSHAGLWHDLGRQWPEYASYVVSFLTIGIIWVNHHSQFQVIERSDRTLLFLNLLLLMWVALIPFPTSLVATYLRAGHDQHAAAAVYAGTFLLMGSAFFSMWRHARRAGLLSAELTPDRIERLTRRNLAGQALYVVAVGVAFVSAPITLVLCFVAAAYYVHPGRGLGMNAG